MKSKREKQLEIALLTEKIERISKKKVVFVENKKIIKEETTREDILKIQQQHLNEWKQLLKPEIYSALEKWAIEKNDQKTNMYDIVRGSKLTDFVVNYLNNYTPPN